MGRCKSSITGRPNFALHQSTNQPTQPIHQYDTKRYGRLACTRKLALWPA